MPRLLAVWRESRRGGRPGGRSEAARGPKGRPRPQAGRSETRLEPDELREVAGAVERLSLGLTRERKLAGARYLDDARLLGAYLLFYWPVSYLQARGVLSELPRPPRSVLDLGSGPGPLALAALDVGATEVTAADRSAQALASARALAGKAGVKLSTKVWEPKGDPQRGGTLAGVASGRRFDVVTFGHVLNELFAPAGADADPAACDARRAALIEEAAALLQPGGSVVVIEPALRDTSRALLRVRDLLVAKGYAVRAPCLFRGACPALLKESDWCHAERPVEPPPLVAEIGKAAGLRREAVKMSYLVLSPPGEAWVEPPPGRVFRIVSEPLPSKGRLRYMACGPEGRMGLALQEKHVGERNRRFERLLRGDVVEITGVEPRGDGLRLGEESEVRVIAEAGRPAPHFRAPSTSPR